MVETSVVRLSNIRLYAFHGAMEQERRVGGWYRVSLSVDYPFQKALDTDDVADTLNYASVFRVVKEEMAVPSNLLEHVAGRIARRLLSDYIYINKVEIEITKENPPMGANCDGASVLLCLSNDKSRT